MSAVTLRTLLLFLYGTGMRVGEALRLRLSDIDMDRGVVTIRGTKFCKSRLVPLGPDVTPKTYSQRIAESCVNGNIIVMIMNLWNYGFSVTKSQKFRKP